jgi:hypothetical protein
VITSTPAVQVVTAPTVTATSAHRATVRRTAVQQRFRLPGLVAGLTRLTLPSIPAPELVAADARRPGLGAIAVAGHRVSLVAPALALLALLAASGSFLLLAQRVERASRPGTA